ncbi:MAG TPA: flagellar hook-associated protein 3 [Acidobacteriaceae bacterium]|jgi:flagellar hook-associated protein 3 FlgL|nr:flagellar hook-associated protein 3 [Acidobacteriaceae bacterium]
MRVNPNLVPDVLADLNQSQTTLNTALQEVSTGKSVNQPSDNPAAAAAMVQNTLETGNVDQYTQNVGSVLSTVQTADSALSTVASSLTQAVSLGTEGANGTNNTSDLQSLAEQVQGILTSVVSQANLSYNGTYLFGGTNSTQPYTADSSSPSGYTYNGNNDTNSVAIGDQMSVQVNLPGSQIFSNSSNNVLSSLSTLVSALQSGSSSAISSATTAVSSALSYVNQQRVFYSNAEDQLNSQDTWLQQETVTLSSQQTALVGVNMAQAATELSQAETANSAALAAAAKVLPESLINYLAVPS